MRNLLSVWAEFDAVHRAVEVVGPQDCSAQQADQWRLTLWNIHKSWK